MADPKVTSGLLGHRGAHVERLYLLRLSVLREHHILRRDHAVHVPEAAVYQLRSHCAGFYGFGRRLLPATNESKSEAVSSLCSPSNVSGIEHTEDLRGDSRWMKKK